MNISKKILIIIGVIITITILVWYGFSSPNVRYHVVAALNHIPGIHLITSSSADSNASGLELAHTGNNSETIHSPIQTTSPNIPTTQEILDALKNNTIIAQGLDVGEGSITASNVIYSVKAGDGIAVSKGQNPTISNTGILSIGGKTGSIELNDNGGILFDHQKLYNADKGSTQNIFKTIAVTDHTDIKADSNNTTLHIAAGNGISLDTSDTDKKLTISASVQNISGWTDDGSIVRLTDASDKVGIGTSNPTSLLSVGSSSGFQVDSNGNIIKLNNVTYSFPSSQGAAGSILQNDGSGGLTWASLGASSIAADSLDFTEFKDNMGLDANTNVALANHNLTFSGIGNIGIGITNPTANLHVAWNSGYGEFRTKIGDAQDDPIIQGDNIAEVRDNGSPTAHWVGLVSTNYKNGQTGYPYQGLYNAGGTLTSPSTLGNSQIVGQMLFRGYNNSAFRDVGVISVTTDSDFTTTNNGKMAFKVGGGDKLTILSNGSIGIGTTGPLITSYFGTSNFLPVSVYNSVSNRASVLELGGNSPVAGSGNSAGAVSFVSNDAGTYRQLGYIYGFRDVASTTGGLVFGTLASGTVSTERMRIDSSGNVGIGTISPVSKLHVVGNGTSSAIFMSGNVGIGTTAPTALVDVRTNGAPIQWGSTSAAFGQLNYTSIGIARILATTGNKISLGSNGANDSLLIDTSGNVGIGITSPSTKLHVVGDIRVTGAYYDSSNSAGSSGYVLTSTGTGTTWSTVAGALSSTAFLQGGNSFGALASLGTNDNNSLGIRTSGVERVRIDTNGNVGVGTSLPSVKLHIVGDGTYAGAFMSGNVGINKINPGATLEIVGASGNGPGLKVSNAFNSTALSITQSGGSGQAIDITDSNVFPATITINKTTTAVTSNSNSAGLVFTGTYQHSGSSGLGRGIDLTVTNNTGSSGTLYGGIISATANTAGATAVGLQVTSASTNGTSYSAIFNGGNVGIGTATPTEKLDIGGASSNLTFSNSTGPHQIKTGGTTHLILAPGGNVGIGTTAPGSRFQVDVGSATTLGKHFSITNGIALSDWRPYQGSTTSALQIQSSATDGLLLVPTTGSGLVGGELISSGDFRIYSNATVGTNIGTLGLVISNGNVGIGTTSPGQKLEVAGTARITGGSLQLDNNQSIAMKDNGGTYQNLLGYTTANNLQLVNGASGSIQITNTGASGAIQFLNNGSERMRIDSAGNVGIGTSSVTALLDILGANKLTNSNGNLFVHTSNAYGVDLGGQLSLGGVYNSSGAQTPFVSIAGRKENATDGNAAGYLAFGTTISSGGSVTEKMRINSVGNVGIGTTAPGSLLVIAGSSDVATKLTITRTDLSKTYYLANDGYGLSAQDSSGSYLLTFGRTSPTVGIGGTASSTSPYLYIGTTGNVGIGTTSPSRQLEVAGSIPQLLKLTRSNNTGSSQIEFANTGGVVSQIGYDAGLNHFAIQNGSLNYLFNINMSSGNVGIGTTSPSTQLHTTGGVRFANFGAGTLQTDANGNLSVSSDERLKNVERPFGSSLDKLLKLSGVVYRWNEQSGLDTTHDYVGFLAQDVEKQFPELVGVNPNGYKSLNYAGLTVPIIEAMKEQQSEILNLGKTVRTVQPISSPLSNLDIQNATISGALTVTSLHVTGDSLFEKTVTFMGEVIHKTTVSFEGSVSFLAKVIFKSDVELQGKTKINDATIVFDKNSVGSAVIKKGARTVSVTFDTEYGKKPSVNSSINLSHNSDQSAQDALDEQILQNDIKYIVTDITTKGFTIKLNKNAPDDIVFSWTAFISSDSKTFESQTSPTSIPTIAPSPTESVSPTASPTVTFVPSPTTVVTPTPTIIPTISVSPSVVPTQ